MTPDEFRQLGHVFVDWVADYRARVASLPVMSQVAPGDIRKLLPTEPPARGESLAAVVADLERIILPGITHWNHPSFFAYFPSNSSLASVLADIVISGLGAQAMSWQTSPSATELEETMMEWLRQMLGLDAGFSGVIHDTASTATLCALLCARERTTSYAQDRGGLQDGGAPLVVYASDQAHSSIEKAALLAGFGRDHLRLVETDDDHALRLDRLRAVIDADRARGLRPSAIVACIGTTATTAVDPLRGIADLAKEVGIWLHVDAAMAGNAMILEECRHFWDGISLCDSLVMNPHKWLGVGFDYSAYFVRDPQHLIRVMSTNPSYLRTAHDDEVKNLRDWGIPLGRRFRAMKLWFLLREHGTEALCARLRRDLENAAWLRDQVDAAPGWERMAPTLFQTVCLRHVPKGASEGEIGAHNLRIARAINDSGRAYLTPSILKGKQILRVSIGAEATERSHVEALWADLRRAAGAE